MKAWEAALQWRQACLSCSTPLVPGRQQPPPGHGVHHGRGLCRSCYCRAYKAGRLDTWPLRTRRQASCSRADCGFCDDMLWLAESGAGPQEWVHRLGTNLNALSKRLYRHGLYDMANQAERIRYGQRRQRDVA